MLKSIFLIICFLNVIFVARKTVFVVRRNDEFAYFGIAHARYVGDGAAVETSLNNSVEQAVPDGKNALSVVFPTDVLEELCGTREHLLNRLNIGWEFFAFQFRNVCTSQTSPVAFAQQTALCYRHAKIAAHRLCCVQTSLQIAAQKNVYFLLNAFLQLKAKTICLLPTFWGKAARQMTLQYLCYILFCLSVSSKIKCKHKSLVVSLLQYLRHTHPSPCSRQDLDEASRR